MESLSRLTSEHGLFTSGYPPDSGVSRGGSSDLSVEDPKCVGESSLPYARVAKTGGRGPPTWYWLRSEGPVDSEVGRFS